MLGKVFGLYRAVLVVAAGLLTGVGCSSGGAGSVPARSTEQVAAQRPQAVGNTLPAPTLATPAFPAVCNFATGAFGQVLKNGITCNLPEPGSSASIQVPLPKYLYSDPIQSDCSTANLVAVINQGTDTYGTSISLSPDSLPGNSSCIGVGATTVTVTRGPEAFYYGHPGVAYGVSSNLMPYPAVRDRRIFCQSVVPRRRLFSESISISMVIHLRVLKPDAYLVRPDAYPFPDYYPLKGKRRRYDSRGLS